MEYVSNFGFTIPRDFSEDVVTPILGDCPPVLDGADIYDTLCPINPLTGHRDNPLNILQYALSPANSRLLETLLQELPTVKEMDAPDDVKLDMLVSRLDTGTFAERDKVMNRLSAISDLLFDSKDSTVSPNSSPVIEFDSSDNPNPVTND